MEMVMAHHKNIKQMVQKKSQNGNVDREKEQGYKTKED